MFKIKKLLKKFALYSIIAAILFSVTIPVLAANTDTKCKVTVNGQTADWKLEPFQATQPLGDTIILIPMRDFFTTLGYTVTYDSKLGRSFFTADKESAYDSFYVDIKTGEVVNETGKEKASVLWRVHLVYNSLYVAYYGGTVGMKDIAGLVLNGAEVEIKYDYVYNPNHENFMLGYKAELPIENNLSSLTIKISNDDPDHPYVGEQYVKYNTGDWFTLDKPTKINSQETFWEGFSNLKFFNGEFDKNPCVKTKGYAIGWDLMDETGKEINKLRKKNGLSELTIDHTICFVSVGADNPKRDSVFDNIIWYWEGGSGNGAFAGHTPFKKVIKGECASGTSIINHGTTTAEYASYFVNKWQNSPAHKDIILTKKFTSVGVLVLIDEYGRAAVMAAFK